MTRILLVTSSPRPTTSHSTRLATQLVERVREARPEVQIISRDLARRPVPHIDEAFTSGIGLSVDARSAMQAQRVLASDDLVDELLGANLVVIAAAMINFGIPSSLKAWIDHVARAGRTFRYGEDGPHGLATGKKVVLVVASGGIYSHGAGAREDFAVPYLETVLAFMGMRDVTVLRVEGVALGGDAEERALARAQAEIAALDDLLDPPASGRPVKRHLLLRDIATPSLTK